MNASFQVSRIQTNRLNRTCLEQRLQISANWRKLAVTEIEKEEEKGKKKKRRRWRDGDQPGSHKTGINDALRRRASDLCLQDRRVTLARYEPHATAICGAINKRINAAPLQTPVFLCLPRLRPALLPRANAAFDKHTGQRVESSRVKYNGERSPSRSRGVQSISRSHRGGWKTSERRTLKGSRLCARTTIGRGLNQCQHLRFVHTGTIFTRFGPACACARAHSQPPLCTCTCKRLLEAASLCDRRARPAVWGPPDY